MSWNVMGLTTMKEELSQLVKEASPDVLVLTETKLTERTQRKCWVRHVLNDYWVHYSSCIHKSHQTLREGSGGVAVAVKKFLIPQGCMKRLQSS